MESYEDENKFMTTSCILEQSSKEKLTWKLTSVWTLKKSDLFFGGVQLGVFISHLASR